MSMFCFQCEQTAQPNGCTVQGVCGKTAPVANLQDELTAALIGLARAMQATEVTLENVQLLKRGLFMCVTKRKLLRRSCTRVYRCDQRCTQ